MQWKSVFLRKRENQFQKHKKVVFHTTHEECFAKFQFVVVMEWEDEDCFYWKD